LVQDVGDVDEAVDAVLDADEHAEFGDVLDGALKDGAFGVLLGHQFPGIGLDLLHAEADALLVTSTPRMTTSTSSPV
jgi:hypothetical protein